MGGTYAPEQLKLNQALPSIFLPVVKQRTPGFRGATGPEQTWNRGETRTI